MKATIVTFIVMAFAYLCVVSAVPVVPNHTIVSMYNLDDFYAKNITAARAKRAAAVNKTITEINAKVAAKSVNATSTGPRKTPGVSCDTRNTCTGCLELHTCAWSQGSKCVAKDSLEADLLRHSNLLMNSCPKTMYLGRTAIAVPDAPIVRNVVPANTNPEIIVTLPVIATADAVASLPVGIAVKRSDMSFVETEEEVDEDDTIAEEEEEEY